MVYLGGALGVNTFLMYGFFNTVPGVDRRGGEDRRRGACAHLLHDDPSAGRADPRRRRRCSSFIASFNDYVIASVILIQPENQTLAVGLIRLVSNPRYADWPAFSAGAMMAAIPVLIVFLFLQKYIVGGLTAGSVK